MPLFTDGPVSTVDDLTAYESNLTAIAESEGIDLEGKLNLAQNEVAVALTAAGLRPGNIYWAGPFWNSSGAEVNLNRIDLTTVVVTQPLKLWHAFQALAITYRDAYNRKLNDKYLPKWNEYKGLARWASNLLFQSGMGMVGQPLPRPAQPAADWVSGALGAMTLYVQMTWVGPDGVTEGAPSLELAVATPANQNLRVTPPATPAGPPPPSAPYQIGGWNVYVGTASGAETRQNGQALAVGEAWVMPDAGPAAGAAAGTGQMPDYYRTVPRFAQRG